MENGTGNGDSSSYLATLRDQLSQLRSIRMQSTQTYYQHLLQSRNNHFSGNSEDNETQTDSVASGAIDRMSQGLRIVNEEPIQINTQASDQLLSPPATNPTHPIDRDHIYRKFKATVKLLAESLEEQGNLRALMELTSNPSVYDSILQSEIFHLAQLEYDDFSNASGGSLPTTNPLSPELLQNIKYRALWLEQDQLISQVM